MKLSRSEFKRLAFNPQQSWNIKQSDGRLWFGTDVLLCTITTITSKFPQGITHDPQEKSTMAAIKEVNKK